jgi:bifunctional enzyme CysN/CysC
MHNMNQIITTQQHQRNHHRGGVLWFTGLSGAGKTTISEAVQQQLCAEGYQIYVLDGDVMRTGLCSDLGFTPEDRHENMRRVGEVAKLFAHAGFIVISAFISPYQKDRHLVRALTPELFHNIYIKADLATCEKRDVKGLYAKARAGEIQHFTGISAPYEVPDAPDLVLDTMHHTVQENTAQLIAYIKTHFTLET